MTSYANTPYDMLEIGMQATAKRLCRTEDFLIYASSSGNHNPVHLPNADHNGDGETDEAIAPSMWVASLISMVLGNQLPGPGTLYESQTLNFVGRAHAGDELTICVTLTDKRPDRIAVFDCVVERADRTRIVEGEAIVVAPETKMSFEAGELPGLTVQRHVNFDRLIELARPLSALPTAVVAPHEPKSLGGAILAHEKTLIQPILIGQRPKIEAAAAELGADLSPYEIIDVPDKQTAAVRGVALVNEGLAGAIMKGHLHTDVLLHAVIKSDSGLRTHRRLSHVFVMDVPGLNHLLMITDAAINITPTLEDKVDIIKNAIDLGLSLGVETPKVAVLSAVETVTPRIPSTLEAAALAKMSERGQIKDGIVDGPLAMDNAVSVDAAQTKGITSQVAGNADILVAPNLESANMIAKQLTFLAYAEAGGLVVGAKCPIILTSRADDDEARLASCAVAVLHHDWLSKL